MADDATITPTPIPLGARRRIQASTNLLHEWLQIAHPSATVYYEYRLGPTPLSVPGYPLTPATEAMLRRSNLYADAIVIEPARLTIVEAKVIGTPSAISQLRAYANLVLGTPELRQYLGRQMVELHLWAIDSELAHQMATAQGQAVQIFTPPWIEEYIQKKWSPKP